MATRDTIPNFQFHRRASSLCVCDIVEYLHLEIFGLLATFLGEGSTPFRSGDERMKIRDTEDLATLTLCRREESSRGAQSTTARSFVQGRGLLVWWVRDRLQQTIAARKTTCGGSSWVDALCILEAC